MNQRTLTVTQIAPTAEAYLSGAPPRLARWHQAGGERDAR